VCVCVCVCVCLTPCKGTEARCRGRCGEDGEAKKADVRPAATVHCIMLCLVNAVVMATKKAADKMFTRVCRFPTVTLLQYL
jgi:hypothetical protein